jgi:hypothetical protein
MTTQYKKNKAQITAIREKKGKDAPILRGPNKRIRPSTIINVAKRWKERLGYSVRSHDKPNKNYHYNAKNVAQRLAVHELMNPLKRLHLDAKTWLTVERLLHHRNQKVKKSEIPVRSQPDVLLLKLLNSVGEQKTLQILDIISKRSQDIQKAANSEKIASKSDSDAFSNIGPSVTLIHQMLEMDLANKPDFVNRIQADLHQRHAWLKEIKHIKNKVKRQKLEKLLLD